MAKEEKAPVDVPATEAKASKAETAYFKSTVASGLTIVKKDQTTERFTSYWDMFKGDRVKVGFHKTSDPEVIKILRNDNIVQELTADQYAKEIKELDTSPLYNV